MEDPITKDPKPSEPPPENNGKAEAGEPSTTKAKTSSTDETKAKIETANVNNGQEKKIDNVESNSKPNNVEKKEAETPEEDCFQPRKLPKTNGVEKPKENSASSSEEPKETSKNNQEPQKPLVNGSDAEVKTEMGLVGLIQAALVTSIFSQPQLLS